MPIIDIVFDYLKKKIPDFVKSSKNGAPLFTCPNIINHKWKSDHPTATIISGTEKIYCLTCSWKGTIADIVRLLEEDKKSQSDEEILDYLTHGTKNDIYPNLDSYVSYKWSLTPIAKNAKSPIEKEWTDKIHTDRREWLRWLQNGYNIGLRTGEVSNVTAIDYDKKGEETEEKLKLKKLLDDNDTLVAKTPSGGRHYIFKYDKEIVQAVDIGGLKIDIRNDGGCIVIDPSKLSINSYKFTNLGAEIKELSVETKTALLSLLSNVAKKPESDNTIVTDEFKVIKEGGRNNFITSLGGLLINKLSPEHTEFVLSVINNNFIKPSLPSREVKALLGSLEGYKQTEESTLEKSIYEYLKLMQTDITAKDLVDSLKITRAAADKYLSKFVKDGKAIRLARGRYKFKERVEWLDTIPTAGTSLPFKVPYFEELQDWESGDIIVVGGKPGTGKTIMSMNMLAYAVEQNILPYYIYSESGSRFLKTAKQLNLLEGEKTKFYNSYHGNPLSIEIEPNSFTVLDWLLISEKENSDTIFKYFNDEMQRKGGLLVIFMQLKQDYNWYAPNMITQFPALAARYIYDSEDGASGHFQLDKIRDSLVGTGNIIVPCEYDRQTRKLIKKSII